MSDGDFTNWGFHPNDPMAERNNARLKGTPNHHDGSANGNVCTQQDGRWPDVDSNSHHILVPTPGDPTQSEP